MVAEVDLVQNGVLAVDPNLSIVKSTVAPFASEYMEDGGDSDPFRDSPGGPAGPLGWRLPQSSPCESVV